MCHSVPICRTGTQEYLPKEIGEAEDDGALVEVHREESEVFKPAAIASFEGKPVTDDHPPVGVDSSNYASYTKGTVQNVHRGTGEDADKLVCDLVIYDAGLIAKIDAGKRDISCGYDCEYIKDGDKTYRQANIIGNHVAVVDDGRAGHSVSIRDAKPKGGKKMPRPTNILQRMFARFAQDAEPEEIREAARAVDEAEAAQNGPQQPPRDEREETTHDADYAAVMDAVNALNERINALQGAHDEEPDEEEDGDREMQSLDSLEEELENGKPQQEPPTEDSDEDSVTVPPEQLEERPQEDEDVPAEEQEKQPPQDRRVCDAALSMVRAMKPYIAMMPPRQRKHAADALSAAARRAMNVRDTQPLNGGYGALTRRKTADAAAKLADARAFGENCRKRNPHYQHKEEK